VKPRQPADLKAWCQFPQRNVLEDERRMTGHPINLFLSTICNMQCVTVEEVFLFLPEPHQANETKRGVNITKNTQAAIKAITGITLNIDY
jgi:hypothetical protein